MRISIDIDNGLVGYVFKDGRKIVKFEDLSRQEQIHICNAFANGYNLFVKAIKQE